MLGCLLVTADEKETLATIKSLAAKNFIRLPAHSRGREQRVAHIVAVGPAFAHSLFGMGPVTDHQTWKVTGGIDLEGDDLFARVVIEADVIVVTVT